MADGSSLKQQWQDFRPSKTMLFWSCVGCVILTMIVGFTWGGWVTGGTAQEMAEEAAEQGRAKLAAAVCVEQFLTSPNAGAQLASLKETDSWKQDSFIEEGGWATLPGMEDPVSDAAELCANQLAGMEELPVQKQEAATINDNATVAQ